jgi:hypothetical protein
LPALFFVEGEAAIRVASTIVPLEQMAEVEDGRLVLNGVPPEFQAGERPHRADVVERLLGARVGEPIPLLQAIDPQHHPERIGATPAVRPGMRIMRRDRRLKLCPGHHLRHLRKENIALGALLLGRIVKRRKAELAHDIPANQVQQVSHASIGLLRGSLVY